MRPAVFVGSSSEGREVAEALQVALDESCEIEVWSQGVFGLSETTLESLVLALDRFDFAVLVVTPDDVATKRGHTISVPRDNVIFELGLFIGGLGRERTFLLSDRSHHVELPSDLGGVTHATFEPHSSGNLAAALGAPASRIKTVIARLGLRDLSRSKRLNEAADTLKAAGNDLERLVELLARSRKVELEITLEQFGPLLGTERGQTIRRDIEDLTESLRRRQHSGSPE